MTDKKKPNKVDGLITSIETTTSLSDCHPIDGLQEGKGLPEESTIRRPKRDEAFTLVDDPVKLACVVKRNEDNLGQYAGESYHPVTASLQNKVEKGLRLVAFHPCRSQTGENFILPQKLQLANSLDNTWISSLAEALSTLQGQWLKLWSNSGLHRYEFDPVDIESDCDLAYPDFQKDLDMSLSANIIDSLEHPDIQHLMTSQSSHSGWGAFNYDV